MHPQQVGSLLDPYVGQPVSVIADRFGPPSGHFASSAVETTYTWENFGAGQSGMAGCRILVVASRGAGQDVAAASQADHFPSRGIRGHFLAPKDCHEQTGSSIIIVGTSTECLVGLRHLALGITGNYRASSDWMFTRTRSLHACASPGRQRASAFREQAIDDQSRPQRPL